MTHTYPSTTEQSVLAILRSVIPQRALHSFEEAKRIAELQASRLLELHGIGSGTVPTEMIAQLPKIEIESVEVSVSGASFWNGRAWIIQLNRYESPARQRFTLAHEYKHIIDHTPLTVSTLGLGRVPLSAPNRRPTTLPDAC
ncbi:MAG: ImmA/IrrE family metallo-endopeptidase [Thermoleophilia bacterium]|nr:ImmA/IrrE family metallo-endopeptidase [Thermoleophilia bacterium]